MLFLHATWRGSDNVLTASGDSRNTMTLEKKANGRQEILKRQGWRKGKSYAGGDYFSLYLDAIGPSKVVDLNPSGPYLLRPRLTQRGQFSGQAWKATVVKATPPYFYLTTQWKGPNMALDIVNDGKRNNIARMSKKGNYTGQWWHLTPTHCYGNTAHWNNPANAQGIIK